MVPPLVLQVLDVVSFVLEPARYQLFQRGVIARRRGTRARRLVQVELREVSASKVVHQVAGAQV